MNQSFNVNTNDFNLKQSESLSVLYSNVDCFTQSKKLELECLSSNKHVNIIGLTEIYPKISLFENRENLYQLQDYDLFLSNSPCGKGVVLYVSKELCADLVTIETDFQESVWCSVKRKFVSVTRL